MLGFFVPCFFWIRNNMTTTLKLGFIGTGGITEALITGMLNQNSFAGDVLVSRRTEARSSKLAAQFSHVTVVADNQAIVDATDWVFISVLPSQTESLLRDLRFREEQTVISMVAGRPLESLRSLVAPATNVFRIIPMPPIELGLGPIVITPPDETLCELFGKFGTAVPVKDEDQFSVFSASSAIMAAYFEWTAAQARWIEAQGVPKEQASVYATSLIRALAEMTMHVDADGLQAMSRECLTAGGLNEQVLNESIEENWFEQMDQRLDRIAQRLENAKEGSV